MATLVSEMLGGNESDFDKLGVKRLEPSQIV